MNRLADTWAEFNILREPLLYEENCLHLHYLRALHSLQLRRSEAEKWQGVRRCSSADDEPRDFPGSDSSSTRFVFGKLLYQGRPDSNYGSG
jgi:hypothetical protein